MSTSINRIRKEIKQEIKLNSDKNLPAIIFYDVDLVIRRISGRTKKLPDWYVVLFLSLLIQLPTLLITIIFKEFSQWESLGFIWAGYLVYGLVAPVMVYYQHKYIAHEMSLIFVDSIVNYNDLIDLKKTLDTYWNYRRFWANTVIFTVFWCLAFSFVNSVYLGRFIGFGLSIGTIVFGLIAGSGYSYLPWFIQFSWRLGQYDFETFGIAPAHSEIISCLKRFYNNFIYMIAGYFVLGTFANAFNIWATVLVIVVGWVPTILLFVIYQSSLHKIITREKWVYLKKMQAQMISLANKNITNKDSLETVNRLMDFHERIRQTPDSALDFKSMLNFLNQLMLPLLGFLLANINKVFDLFR